MQILDQSLYSGLFLDSLLSTLILPIHQKWMFATMDAFPYYDFSIMLILAISGAFIGSVINYILGLLIAIIKSNKNINKYLILMMIIITTLFSWVNILGSFLSFMCGYMRVKIIYSFLALAISQIMYYLIIV